ncbi:MAG: hypothetical protein ACR2P5_07690 [Gammaproteobacteria bacterium]
MATTTSGKAAGGGAKAMKPDFKQVARWILGGMIVLLFAIATIIVLIKGEIQFINLILGALIGSTASIVGYYFGSSEEK